MEYSSYPVEYPSYPVEHPYYPVEHPSYPVEYPYYPVEYPSKPRGVPLLPCGVPQQCVKTLGPGPPAERLGGWVWVGLRAPGSSFGLRPTAVSGHEALAEKFQVAARTMECASKCWPLMSDWKVTPCRSVRNHSREVETLFYKSSKRGTCMESMRLAAGAVLGPFKRNG